MNTKALLAASFSVASLIGANAQALQLLNTYSTGLSTPHAAAYDAVNDTVWAHGSFATHFVEFSRSGVLTGNSFAQPGTLSDDSDFTFLNESLNINGVIVPAGTAIFATGDDFDGPGESAHLFAINPITGTILADMDLPGTIFGAATHNNLVGVAHSGQSDTLFFTTYSSDAIAEFDTSSGTTVNEFTLSPVGTSFFNVFYGDVELLPSDGYLYVGGKTSILRVLTTEGNFVRDYDLTDFGVTGELAGLAANPNAPEIWIATTTGELHQFAVPEPSTLGIVSLGLLILARRRRAKD